MFSAGKKSEASTPSQNDAPRGQVTTIAHGVRLEGDFKSEGDVVIDGEVQGKVTALGRLTVGAQAKLKAEVAAGQALVAGELHGPLTVKGRLELKSTARVLGDVSCETASIEAGAVLQGKVSIGAPMPKRAEASEETKGGK